MQNFLSVLTSELPPTLTLDRKPENYRALTRFLEQEVQWVERVMLKRAEEMPDPNLRALLQGPTGGEAQFLRFYLAELILEAAGHGLVPRG